MLKLNGITSISLSVLASALLMGCQPASDGSAAQNSVKALKSSAASLPSVKMTVGDLSGLHMDTGPSNPVIVIVPGSGPTDNNGNSPLGVSSNMLKRLAERLAADNISTVRVDKRGMFSSAKAGDPNAVTVDIYAQDYRDWVKAVRAKTGQSCVYLLGHSEGALMVSAAAVNQTDICGLILLSGMGRSMGDVLRAQLKANPANAPIFPQALAAIEALEAGEDVETASLHPALANLFAPQVQGFLKSVLALDPSELARKADQRTIIIQGDNDLQISVEDATRLANATQGDLVIVPGVNHVLRDAPEDRAGNFATYTQPDLPIADGVVEAIAAFVAAQ